MAMRRSTSAASSPRLAQASALDLGGRRDQQDDEGVGVPLPHLAGALQVDLEDTSGRAAASGSGVP